jgi:hypothetical protein
MDIETEMFKWVVEIQRYVFETRVLKNPGIQASLHDGSLTATYGWLLKRPLATYGWSLKTYSDP